MKTIDSPLTKESGVATLAVAIILLLVATLAAFATSRSAVTEQKLANNDVRTQEAYAAALKGLDWGVDWIKTNLPVLNKDDCDPDSSGTIDDDERWTDTTTINTDGWPCDEVGALYEGLADTTSVELSNSYSHEIKYTTVTSLNEADATFSPQPIILVTSTATALSDSQVTQTVELMVERTAVALGNLYDGPPLIVEDGLTGVTGTAQIELNEDGYAIGTINAYAGDIDISDPSHADYDPSDPLYSTYCDSSHSDWDGGGSYAAGSQCVNTGHYEECQVPSNSAEGTACNNGSSPELEPDNVAKATSTSGSLWTDLFNSLSKEEFQRLSATDEFSDIFIWLDSSTTSAGGRYSGYLSSNNLNQSLGSVDSPVIVVFDDDISCSMGFTGNNIIYGVVYIENPGTCGGSWDPGWGNTTICGTVAVEGQLTKFTANADLLDCDLDDDYGGSASKIALVTPIPNTFKDFDS